jgi:hypothetical protein
MICLQFTRDERSIFQPPLPVCNPCQKAYHKYAIINNPLAAAIVIPHMTLFQSNIF